VQQKITRAINRLNKKLPLKARQENLPPGLQQLHRDILYSYLELGRSFTADEIASLVDDSTGMLEALRQSGLVVFDDAGEPVGAYPFTMEQRDHIVDTGDRAVHCMCALDSLAVSPMYGVALEVRSSCYLRRHPIVIRQKGLELVDHDDVRDVFFAINWGAAASNSCCADSLCTEMIFIKGRAAADQWLREDKEYRQIFTLDEAIQFAAGFFVPLVR